MSDLADLLSRNRAWAADVTRRDPDFFASLVAQQSPQYLWIGCSDSRVPANQITGLAPGELFVHRNVANMVVHTDLNCLSVLQYAVDALKVRDVLVVGHYGCGGVKAAYQHVSLGLIDNWLRHIQDVRERHDSHLRGAGDEAATIDRLCELNVIEQVRNVCLTTIVRDAWDRGHALTVHGWIYSVADGLLNDLGCSISSADAIDGAHATAVARVTARR
ncbi:MAG TPA: carbonate dehydratase [Luteitalea sp.]|nr:carbonate dehydratase [Luteitalea sp.]